MPNLALTGYPISAANRILNVLDHTGPASYTTGGENVPASDFNMSTLDIVLAAQLTLSGNYSVLILYPAMGTGNVQSINIAWYAFPGGSQVSPGTNLTAEHIHLIAIGI
jgi:hypothetical protein